MAQIKALLFNDPSCPWGYSASPALRTLEWRYRDQIDWHLAVIGLSDGENPPRVSRRDFPVRCIDLRDRYGMPFAIEPKLREMTSERACRAITAARLVSPGSEWRVLRTFQLLNFNTPLLLDDDAQLTEALGTVPGLDAGTVMAAIDSPEVAAAYEQDHSHARSAEGGATHLQGKSASHDGGQRFTAPTIILERDGRRFEVGGFQPIDAYDVVIANMAPDLKRMDPAESVIDALGLYPAGLTTQEVAAVMADGPEGPDRAGAEKELTGLLGDGEVRKVALGSDALWIA